MVRTSLSLLIVAGLVLPACLRPPKKPPLLGQSETPANPTAETEISGFPRLTHMQWENAVRDTLLLEKNPGLSAQFAADPSTLFNNDRHYLKVSPNLWSDYQLAAEAVARQLASDPIQVKRLAPVETLARAIVEALALRAFKKPADAATLDALTAIFQKGRELTEQTDAQAAGLQAVITVLLQAPYFIYRVELGADQGMDAYQIASRLSFAIWNTIPDAALFAAAADGSLKNPDVLKAQINRMMKDTRASDLVNYFHARLFRIDSFLDVKDLGPSLKKEAELYFNEVALVNHGGLNSVLTSSYSFVNAQTAPLYGVPAPAGTGMVKVELDPSQRLGILTQLGFLAKYARPHETDPIHRGVFINAGLMCSTLAPPPGLLPPLPAAEPSRTTRERVNAHTGPGTCGASCHGTKINPAGFAFENYDQKGQWRTTDNGFPVNAADTFVLSGEPLAFNGAIEFIKGLTTRKEVHQCYVSKAFELLYGRPAAEQDRPLISAISTQSLSGLSTQDLFLQLLLNGEKL